MRAARLVVFSTLRKDYRPSSLQNKNALAFGKYIFSNKMALYFLYSLGFSSCLFLSSL